MTWFQSAANQTAAIQSHAEVVTFVDLDFPSGHLRVHTRTGTVAWGSGSPIPQWLGVGKLGSIDVVREDAELRPNTITLILSGTDTALITAAMDEAYHGRAARIYQGLLDVNTFALIATPETVFIGIMDTMTITLGQGTGSINVQCESELARWDRPRSFLYTQESQRMFYPDDEFYNMVTTTQSRTVDWYKHKGPWGADYGGFR